jgi:hypothetical protein
MAVLDEAHKERKPGALAALALLIAILLGQGGAAGAAGFDSRAAGLGQKDPARSGAILRPLVRSADEDSNTDDDPALLPQRPRASRDIISARPAGEATARAASLAPSRTASAYQARAPPAA